jgi:VWFA-related protein
MIIELLLPFLLASPTAIGVRVELAALGKGASGTVVGVAIQVAPEDRTRLGDRAAIEVSLRHGEQVVDRGRVVVGLAADGSAMLFREWPVGAGAVRVDVASLDGSLQGGWRGEFVVPAEERPFEAPPGAPPDAVALAGAAPIEEGGVRFLAPGRSGGIGALQLELQAPADAARVEFFQDDQMLVTRRKAPWTVSVPLGEVARRTTVRATAYRADGGVLGEDAIVLNGAGNQLPIEILLGPAPASGDGDRLVTVAVANGQAVAEVVLRLDEAVVSRWTACPCAVRVSTKELAQGRVLTAEATNPRGVRGEAVRLIGESGFVAEIRVEQVELPVVVFDREGKLVTDLPRDAFRVFEDDVEVPLDAFATTADLPLSLGVVVDVSGSMRDAFAEVRKAVSGFVGAVVRPGDSVFLMTFAFEPRVEVEWTRDARPVVERLDRITPDGGTSLHDAAVRSLEQFRGRRGRSAVVLLTDGDDTTSRTGWDVALRYARTARVPVFTIGFRIGVLDFFVREHLKDLTAATGGESFYAGKGALDDVYRRISDQLRAQYLLSYRSPSTRGAQDFRNVRVEVKGDGFVARTIAGYFPSV